MEQRTKHLLITGATGLIGQSLVEQFIQSGWSVIAWVRDRQKASRILPHSVECITDLNDIPNERPIDLVINLAGESIAGGLWTKSRRDKLLNSRVRTTQVLMNFLNRMKTPPRLIIQASATGIYGDGGELERDETADVQPIFMSELCQEWEATAKTLTPSQSRLVFLRLGVVLSQNAPAFDKLVFPLKLGLGAVLGSGKQYFPWVHIADVKSIVTFIVENESVSGALNVVAPHAVTQKEFTEILAEHLQKPRFLRVPAGVLKAALGELSDLFLKGQRAVPSALLTQGYKFQYPTLNSALKDLLH